MFRKILLIFCALQLAEGYIHYIPNVAYYPAPFAQGVQPVFLHHKKLQSIAPAHSYVPVYYARSVPHILLHHKNLQPALPETPQTHKVPATPAISEPSAAPTKPEPTIPSVIDPKIVIIGAGVSGIAAATKLLEYGFENIEILEAEPRIGGRMHTVPFADNVIEMGAQWIHGKKNNVVYDLSHKHDLVTLDTIYTLFNFMRSNREPLPEETEEALMGIMDQQSMEEMQKYNGSLGSYFENLYYDSLEKREYSDIDSKIADEFFEIFKKMELSSDAADSVYEVSSGHIGENLESAGLHYIWKEKGYNEFLKLLLKTHETGKELGVLEKYLRLSKTVVEVNWNTGELNAEINCQDGEVIKADHVIVTVSLGVLKEQHLSLFKPQLPEEKIHAIDGLGFGHVKKIFLEFPEEFWPANWTGIALMWLEEDLTQIRQSHYPWLEDTFAFHPILYKPRVLLGWVVGENARKVEALSDSELMAGCMFLLRHFLNWKIPDPINFITSDWSSNVNFRGVWSYRSIHADEYDTDPSALAKPLVAKGDPYEKPLVQFAGEASNMDRYGTVHGATETGWREAKVLAEFYGKEV